MNVTDYWPMAREYSVWNAAVAALQFWTADLEVHEMLFSCFMTTLNAAFKSKLTLEDEGYESDSENFYIATPLKRTSKKHLVSTDENVSFDPETPCSTGVSQSHCKPIRCWLTFSSSDDEDTLQPTVLHLPV